jgi:hypothetical protein
VVNVRDNREVPNRSAVHALLSKPKRPHDCEAALKLLLHFIICVEKVVLTAKTAHSGAFYPVLGD